MTSLNLAELDRRATTARRPAEVFGPLAGPLVSQLAALGALFRTFAQLTHPDHCPGEEHIAQRTFARLQHWRQRAKEELQAGIYNASFTPTTITLRSGTISVQQAVRSGDYYTLYRCTATHLPRGDLVLKAAREPADNELVLREARALRILAEAPSHARRYFPRLLDSFVLNDGGISRQSLLIEHPARTHSLARIRHAYAAGLDPRDAAWMFNRVLEALCFAHQQGLVHGAVLPPNLHFSLENHGLILAEWAYAVPRCEPLTAISTMYADWYPIETRAKFPATPGTDIFLAARCLVFMLGGDPVTGELSAAIPAPFRRFANGCLLASPSRRPQDAGSLREEFGELLRNLYGPRAFRPLAMPA